MADPFLGEIRMFSGTYAPQGWAICSGQLLQISQYNALYAILGSAYGGDGKTTFGLPDLRNRFPVQPLDSNQIGMKGGATTVVLTQANLPPHTHTVSDPGHAHAVTLPAHTHAFDLPSHTHPFALPYSNAGDFTTASTGSLLDGAGSNFDSPGASTSGTLQSNPTGSNSAASSTTSNSNAVTSSSGVSPTGIGIALSGGSSQAFNIMPPYLTINFIIALEGLWPTRP